MIRYWIRTVVALTCLLLAPSGDVLAQSGYPDRPIRILYGFPPGSDLMARVVADKLASVLGKPAVVENLTGAAGGIAADRTAKAAPDGYTVGILTGANIVINGSLYAKLPYDPLKDLKPVAQLWGYPNVLYVSNDVPAKTVQEFLAHAKANPGKVSYAHSGLGTTQHLGGELLKLRAGVDLQQIPYRGPPQIVTDLTSGRISMAFLNPGVNLALAREGKIRALAVTSRMRVPFAADLPTMIESGFPDFDFTPWFGAFVPAGTPQPIVDRLSKEIGQILAQTDVRKKLEDLDLVSLFRGPEELAATISTEAPYWARMIKELGIPQIDQ